MEYHSRNYVFGGNNTVVERQWHCSEGSWSSRRRQTATKASCTYNHQHGRHAVREECCWRGKLIAVVLIQDLDETTDFANFQISWKKLIMYGYSCMCSWSSSSWCESFLWLCSRSSYHKALHPCDITYHVVHVRSRTVELLTKARRDGYKFHLTGLVFLWQTLNDVLLAMVDASLHRYLQGRYHKTTDLYPPPPPAGISLWHFWESFALICACDCAAHLRSLQFKL